MPKRSRPLDRGQIVAAAMEIADRSGLDSLTMRSVGRELGVEAMSLYNHIADKDDLLDALVDCVLEQIHLPVPGNPWKEEVRLRASTAREAFGRHPWAIRLLESRHRNSGPLRLAYFDAMLGTLRSAGFSSQFAVRAFSTLDAFIFGYILQESSLAFQDDASLQEVGEDLLRQMGERYPHLAAVTAQTMAAGYDHDREFGFGLNLILDALERQLDRPGDPAGEGRAGAS